MHGMTLVVLVEPPFVVQSGAEERLLFSTEKLEMCGSSISKGLIISIWAILRQILYCYLRCSIKTCIRDFLELLKHSLQKI